MVEIKELPKLLAFVKKEFKQLARNKMLLRIVIVAPVLQVLLLSYVVRTEVKEIEFKVINRAPSALTRTIISKLDASPYLEYRGNLTSENEIFADRAQVFIVFPHDFPLSNAVVIVDGSDPTVAQQAAFYAVSILFYESIPKSIAVEPATTILYNPGLKSSDYMVPAIIGVVLMLMGALLTSLSIVREKEIGTLEQLNVTPLKNWQLIAGKIIPYFTILTAEVMLVEIIAVYWFKVPLRGSILTVVAASLLLVVIALSLGITVSAVSSTQHQALTTSFFVFLPLMLLSGIIFPIQSMPEIIQYATYLIPLRYYFEIIRSVFLKGAGFKELYFQFLMLTLIAALLFALASTRFRKVS